MGVAQCPKSATARSISWRIQALARADFAGVRGLLSFLGQGLIWVPHSRDLKSRLEPGASVLRQEDRDQPSSSPLPIAEFAERGAVPSAASCCRYRSSVSVSKQRGAVVCVEGSQDRQSKPR